MLQISLSLVRFVVIINTSCWFIYLENYADVRISVRVPYVNLTTFQFQNERKFQPVKSLTRQELMRVCKAKSVPLQARGAQRVPGS